VPDDTVDRDLLVASVREAGAIARKYFGGEYKSWHKSRGNPVTEADIEIDTFLKETLLAARPQYGWLSEETADNPQRLTSQRIFVVDPIDGTYGFLRGRPHFTIVAAVVEDSRPVAAAIFNPITDEMFAAAIGQGAHMNGAALKVSAKADFLHSRLLTGRDFIDDPHWPTPWPPLTVESRASIAYRMGLVAKGDYDAMISLSDKSDWDLAAGDLIVREAGGCVTSQTGETLRYNQTRPVQQGVICAGPALHQRLLERLREYPVQDS
jgi:myo-inositol-1(or 4)-monophosphatase